MIKRLLYILTFICFVVLPAWATDYHVTYNGAGSHNGLSEANAWSYAEIDLRSTTIVAGDTIYYHDAFSVDLDAGADTPLSIGLSGTPGNYITHDFSDATFTIVNTTTAGQPFFYLNGHDYIYLKDLTLTTGSGNNADVRVISGTSASDSLVIDGFNIDGSFIHAFYEIASWTNFEIKNSYFNRATGYSSSSGNAISIRDANTGSIHNTRFGNWGHSAIEFPSQTGQEVQYIDIYYCYFFRPVNSAYGAYPLAANPGTGGNNHHLYFHHNKMYNIRSRIQLNGVNGTQEYVYIYANVWLDIENCCEDAGDTGCTYGDTSSCQYPNTYGYFKTAIAVHVNNGSEYIYIFNNTISGTAESAFQIFGQSVASNYVYLINNIIDNAANAPYGSTEGSPDSPYGSYATSVDSAISCVGTLTNYSITYNRFNTDISGTNAEGDVDWCSRSPETIASFQAADGGALNNSSGDPGFQSATQLWPVTPIAGMTLSGAPYTSLPMWNELIDPVGTDFTSDPPVVVTTIQLGYIGAYANISAKVINSLKISGGKINQ